MKFLRWLKGHAVVVSLSTALLVAVVLVIKLAGDLNSATACVLTGTYSTWPGPPGDGEYLVLDRGGRFYHYRQFEMLDQGTYTDQGNQIYELNGEAGESYSAVCAPEGVYFFRPDDRQAVYMEKISDISEFINVKP